MVLKFCNIVFSTILNKITSIVNVVLVDADDTFSYHFSIGHNISQSPSWHEIVSKYNTKYNITILPTVLNLNIYL